MNLSRSQTALCLFLCWEKSLPLCSRFSTFAKSTALPLSHRAAYLNSGALGQDNNVRGTKDLKSRHGVVTERPSWCFVPPPSEVSLCTRPCILAQPQASPSSTGWQGSTAPSPELAEPPPAPGAAEFPRHRPSSPLTRVHHSEDQARQPSRLVIRCPEYLVTACPLPAFVLFPP